MYKLHTKRLQQYDRLMMKFNKLKNMVYEINAKEMYQMQKLKQFFLMKAHVPKFSYDTDEIGLLAEMPAKVAKRNTSKSRKDDLDTSQISQKTISKTTRSKVL